MRISRAISMVAGLAMAWSAGMASAEGLVLSGGSSSSRLALFKRQTAILDTRAATQYSASVKLTPHGKAGTAAGQQ